MSDLLDRTELLFRHAPPAFVREDRLSSQAFVPRKADAGKLSVARSSLTTAEAAYRLRVEGLGRPTAGTWAVSVGECNEANLGVAADPLSSPPEPVADPAHALIDFSGLTSRQQESKAQVLVAHARARGRLWP
jgi:hypothetical protein